MVVARLVAMDLESLAGDLDAALRELNGLAGVDDVGSSALSPDASVNLVRRRDAAIALLEIARGNPARARLRLARAWGRPPLHEEPDPEGSFRADALHAVASGILEVVTGNLESASTWFARALDLIAEWGRFGLDRRSRLRARLFVERIRTALEAGGDRSLSAARDLAGQAESLLGDTGEDCMSRVLAVEAHLELSRRLATAGGDDARMASHRAVELSRTLGGRGVPAWDALREVAEKQLAAFQRPC